MNDFVKDSEDMNEIYITIDIDWACDEVFKYTIDYLEKNEIKATFFVTHDTPLLNRLRQSDLFELGVHPNFQYLLNGSEKQNNMQEVLERILNIVPEAKSVRSHSLVQSSPILELFKSKGLEYELNLFIPWYSNMKLQVIKHWNGLYRIPYFWEDDVQCISHMQGDTRGWNIDELLKHKGLKIFNFHPIHIFLNTHDLNVYESVKAHQNDESMLLKYRSDSREIGAFSVLSKLVNRVKKRNCIAKKIGEIGKEKQSCE